MPDIRHLVLIDSTPGKIYTAITTQQRIAAWWSIHNNATPEVGSVYRISFGRDYFKEIKITEMDPHQRVVWEILDAHPEWLITKIVFDIAMGKMVPSLDSIIAAGKTILLCLHSVTIIGVFILKI